MLLVVAHWFLPFYRYSAGADFKAGLKNQGYNVVKRIHFNSIKKMNGNFGMKQQAKFGKINLTGCCYLGCLGTEA